MAISGLYGPFKLSTEEIDAHTPSDGIGVYVLGSLAGGNALTITYIGRSVELNGRLKEHIGEATHYKYGYYSTEDDAYKKECRLYHDFPKAKNSIHPAKPAGSDITCPVCGA